MSPKGDPPTNSNVKSRVTRFVVNELQLIDQFGPINALKGPISSPSCCRRETPPPSVSGTAGAGVCFSFFCAFLFPFEPEGGRSPLCSAFSELLAGEDVSLAISFLCVDEGEELESVPFLFTRLRAILVVGDQLQTRENKHYVFRSTMRC